MTHAPQPPARWHRPLLTVHIVCAVGAVGAVLVLLTLGIAGLRGADPRTVYPAAHLVEAWVVAPSALVALGTGLLQAARSPWGIRYWWVATKLAITVSLTAAVLLVLEPGLAAMADAARAPAAGPPTDAQQLRVALAPALAFVLLVVNAALGIYKPGQRLQLGGRPGRRATAATSR